MANKKGGKRGLKIKQWTANGIKEVKIDALQKAELCLFGAGP